MAKSITYPLPAELSPVRPHWTSRITNKTHRLSEEKEKAVPRELSPEDTSIIASLNEAAEDMERIHSYFDHVTDELLVDCLIYELKAVSLRHKYFLDLCKSKEIVGAFN